MGPHENIQNLPERTGRKRWWGFIHPHNILLDNTEKKKQVEDATIIHIWKILVSVEFHVPSRDSSRFQVVCRFQIAPWLKAAACQAGQQVRPQTRARGSSLPTPSSGHCSPEPSRDRQSERLLKDRVPLGPSSHDNNPNIWANAWLEPEPCPKIIWSQSIPASL